MNVSQFFKNAAASAVVFLFLIPVMTHGATIIVTEGQSISDALTVSAYGDSVLVGSGDYHESGLVLPSGVTLASLSSDPGDYPRLVGDSAETILHCENQAIGTWVKGLVFVGDYSVTEGGPVRGHGIHAVNSSAVISDCSFLGLKASYGGAIYVGKGSAPSIVNCVFDSNGAAAAGGAIALVGGQGLSIEYCLFENNTAFNGGSVLNAALGGSAQLARCTLVDNGDAGMGDIQAWASGLVDVTDCIISESSGRSCYSDYASTPQIHCSDLTGNAGGDWVGSLSGQAEVDGNISLPPMFCGAEGDAGPYSLNEDSPCNAVCGIMGAFEIGCSSSAGPDTPDVASADGDVLPAVTQLRGNYPNPFNPQTTIAFDLSQPGHARVDVYDLAGRLVRTLHSGVLAAGPHQVMWNGRGSEGRMSAAGIYFFRLKTELVTDTQRMTLVK